MLYEEPCFTIFPHSTFLGISLDIIKTFTKLSICKLNIFRYILRTKENFICTFHLSQLLPSKVGIFPRNSALATMVARIENMVSTFIISLLFLNYSKLSMPIHCKKKTHQKNITENCICKTRKK